MGQVSYHEAQEREVIFQSLFSVFRLVTSHKHTEYLDFRIYFRKVFTFFLWTKSVVVLPPVGTGGAFLGCKALQVNGTEHSPPSSGEFRNEEEL
jgi:hypothetical protein